MIGPWTLWALGNGLLVSELATPDAATVSVTAAVRLPQLSPAGLAAARVLVEALRAGSSHFSESRWSSEGSRVNVPPSVRLTGDALMVRLTSSAGRHLVAASYVADLLRNPDFSPENLRRAWGVARREPRDPWEAVVDPCEAAYDLVTPDQVSAFGRWLLRPERVSVSISGPFEAGQGFSALRARLEDWRPAGIVAPPRGLLGEPLKRESRGNGLHLWRWTLPLSDLSDRAVARAWLVATAVGSGKGSALFRAWRVERGWTYRQECRIEGRPEGLVWTVLAVRGEAGDPAEALRLLQEFVQGWKEDDRRRALAMMERSGPAPLNDGVLALTGPEPWRPLAWEETELASYWAMKTGRALDLARWISLAREIPLDEMRRIALDWLRLAQFSSGSGSTNSG